jgi:hypothetical protein
MCNHAVFILVFILKLDLNHHDFVHHYLLGGEGIAAPHASNLITGMS